MKLVLPPLHPGQQEVMEHPARFKVLTTGRRWGKTQFGSWMCGKTAFKGGRAWWVAPSFSIASVGWRMIKRLAHQVPEVNIREVEKLVEFPRIGPDSAIQVRSADDPTSLRGDGLDLVVTDESAFMNPEAWYESLRPALSDKQGSWIGVGTPKGRNWFYDEWTRGQDPEDPEYMSWRFPSDSNPFFPKEEMELVKQKVADLVYRQEYLAEFLADGSGAFTGVEDLRKAERCRCGGPWVVGADIAKHIDFSVFIVMCRKCGDCVEMQRFQKADWSVQKDRLRVLQRRYKARVYLDASGVGDPIYDDLKKERMPVQGVKLGLATKTKVIQALMTAVEQKQLSYPPDWKVLTNELQRYEFNYSARGVVSYSAPQGYHDDAVIALALANWGRRRSRAWVVA